MPNAPRGRDKNITGTGKPVYKRGAGLGTGPVGNAGGYEGRGSQQGNPQPGQRSTGTRSSGRGLIGIIIAVVILLGGGGAGLSGLLGSGSNSSSNNISQPGQSQYQQSYKPSQSTQSSQSSQSYSSLASYLNGFSSSTSSSGWSRTANTGKLDTTVAKGARAKRTAIVGGGKDTVTIMVYMCGTDLENKSGMATSDLQEMLNATLSNKINVLVYTGGCLGWRNNVVSSDVNQIYKLESGGKLNRLESNMGSKSMTAPDTLTEFIKYCAKAYPADRMDLIFWDHGGGSVSGYGYDQKFSSSGSMSLKGINQALKNAGVTFDFIGFDACLMATAETALMLDSYADYMIASEETEPGVGWYYTNWLTNLSKNTSMPTVEIGKNICDDFVDVCAQKCNGQKTTLSVIDLAELASTLPETLSDFANSASDLIKNDDFQTVSKARSGAREFASSSKIDQVDLVNLADRMGTDEGNDLIDAILGAVKYNRTSSNMTNAYGLSVYFPYQRTSYVDKAVDTYASIGLEDDYSKCIQAFASVEVSGQAVSGGTTSPYSSISGSSYSASAPMGTDAISQLLGSLLSGGSGSNSLSGLIGGTGSFYGKSLDMDRTVEYLSNNAFDASALVWTAASNGGKQLLMSEQQWSLVQTLELNVFVDDGEGYIDLGLDNVYEFTEEGGLSGDYDGTWLAINDQPVAFYHINTDDDGVNYTISGYVPVLYNGERAELILVFDNENPYGYIAGVRYVYKNGETETVAKSLTQLENGDVLDFLCDYYSYDNQYLDSYLLGERLTVNGDLTISNVYIDADAALAVYRFTDIYNQHYWTSVM